MAYANNVGGSGQWSTIDGRTSVRAYDQLPAEVRAVIREMRSNIACSNVLDEWRKRRAKGVTAAAFAQVCRDAEQRIMDWSTRETYGPEHPETREYATLRGLR